jgi:hypothetical protein
MKSHWPRDASLGPNDIFSMPDDRAYTSDVQLGLANAGSARMYSSISRQTQNLSLVCIVTTVLCLCIKMKSKLWCRLSRPSIKLKSAEPSRCCWKLRAKKNPRIVDMLRGPRRDRGCRLQILRREVTRGPQPPLTHPAVCKRNASVRT